LPADGQEAWVTYGLSNDAFDTTNSAKLYSIRLAHSADGGKTIDARYDAHDAKAGTYYIHPFLVRESNGALDLVYYAGASDGDTMGSFVRARSTDGGKTWPASAPVKRPITFTGTRASPKWLGDYVGLAWARDNLFTSYADNTAFASHIGFYRTSTIPQ
jgi:hypothetical protein